MVKSQNLMVYFFDVTISLKSSLNTGIQRVVRAIAQESKDKEFRVVIAKSVQEPLAFHCITLDSLFRFLEIKSQNVKRIEPIWFTLVMYFRPLLVFFYRYRLVRVFKDWVRLQIFEDYRTLLTDGEHELVKLKFSDTYITFDAFWNSPYDYERIVQASKLGSKVVILVHDIFPLSHPEWFEKNNILNFKTYFLSGVRLANLLMFTSQSSLGEFERRFPDITTPKEVIPLGSNQILSSIQSIKKNSSSELETKKILMIGTLEPRKNYLEVLNWFESTKLDSKLVIVGRDGWKSGRVKQKIRKLKILGHQIEWLRSVTDSELGELIDTSSIGLCASLDEGYGLPLREFLAHGLPVVASDIAVFREIEQTGIRYFKLGDIESLETAIDQCMNISRPLEITSAATWSDSYTRLFSILKREF